MNLINFIVVDKIFFRLSMVFEYNLISNVRKYDDLWSFFLYKCFRVRWGVRYRKYFFCVLNIKIFFVVKVIFGKEIFFNFKDIYIL